jgi:hypothetical protein
MVARTPYGDGAGTFGLGAVVRAALAGGCSRVVIGIDGRASTDGGAGFLQALGAQILDARGLLEVHVRLDALDIESLNDDLADSAQLSRAGFPDRHRPPAQPPTHRNRLLRQYLTDQLIFDRGSAYSLG